MFSEILVHSNMSVPKRTIYRCCHRLLSSAEALDEEKLGEKQVERTRKVREEKDAARWHTQDSRYPGVNFFNFQPARLG